MGFIKINTEFNLAAYIIKHSIISKDYFINNYIEYFIILLYLNYVFGTATGKLVLINYRIVSCWNIIHKIYSIWSAMHT